MPPKARLLQRVREFALPASAYRRALAEGDVAALWRMWGRFHPHDYQPANWQEAEIQLHVARTGAQSVSDRLRCYSHHWLIERKLLSMLPNELLPKVEQYRPKIVSAVGFAWGTSSGLLRTAEPIITAAVNQRIEEMAADGLLETDPDGVRTEILLTKNRTLHGLFGNISHLKEAHHG